MFRFLNKKAQSTAEYVIVLGIIVAAVMAMQTYIKRGFQGRMKQAVDFVDNGGQSGNNVVTFTDLQYEPYYLTSDFSSQRTSNESETMTAGGGGALGRTTNEDSSRIGNQILGTTNTAD